MSDSLAINAINGIGNQYDPYFWHAFMYPNAIGLQNINQSFNNQNTTNLQNLSQSVSPTSFQGVASINQQSAVQQPVNKKNNLKAGLLLSGIILTGAAILCHRKGGKDLKFFEKIADGFKSYKDETVNWFKKVFAGTEGVAVSASEAAVNKAEGASEVVVTKTGPVADVAKSVDRSIV